ncbi:hypothetical protein J2X68_002631 [Streptomyces sp. 3330]|uniref:hypothetical protein n=1 Tax=Streptomyces sp. 3330 TaxID=2817755 RepID=UPI0028638977|nr:hypothetical protein [Streptomyces sp. 3330]MDR6975943.1 hypothetical protein [Streptomyces sp. 3330]
MGTSLTPEFWERFAALLVPAVGLTCVLTAALERLAALLPRRPGRRTPSRTTPYRPERSEHGMPVHS